MTKRKEKWPASGTGKSATTPPRPLATRATPSSSPSGSTRASSIPSATTTTRTSSLTGTAPRGSAPTIDSKPSIGIRSTVGTRSTVGAVGTRSATTSSVAGAGSARRTGAVAERPAASGLGTNRFGTTADRAAGKEARKATATTATTATTARSETAKNTFSKGREMAAAAARAVAENAASSASARREFVLSAQDFEQIRQRIYKHAGIVLTPSKQDMVYGRLARRLRFHRLSSFADYLALLDKNRAEWELFVNALTTNLTSFFREPHHFERLAKQLQQAPKGRPYRIWCCAASTGEEPYSLAITACEAFDTLSPPVRIVATDLNTEVIAEARTGIYDKNRVSGMAAARLQRFFTPVKKPGSKMEHWQVKAQLRQLVEFDRLNLLEPNWPVSGQFDAIFCRNVMIYFDRDTQYQILKRFVPLLTAEGELYAGHSESFLYASEIFRNVGKTVYQRVFA